MALFCYCYNIFFILLFTAALSACYTTYGMTEKKVYKYFGALLFAFICEAIYMIIVEVFLVVDAETSSRIVYGIYVCALALFSAVEAFLTGRVIYEICEKKEMGRLYGIAVIVAVVTALGFTIAATASSFIGVNTYSAAYLLFCWVYWRRRKALEQEGHGEEMGKYRGMVKVAAISSGIAILENTVYLFLARDLINTYLPFYENRINFAEDFFCVFLSVWLIWFTRREREAHTAQKIEETLDFRMKEFRSQEQEKLKMETGEITAFCKFYGLTERETEILHLILAGKSNQEMSETLYITVGTIKAHIHSIFGKLEVSRRSQLMTRFVDYGTK